MEGSSREQIDQVVNLLSTMQWPMIQREQHMVQVLPVHITLKMVDVLVVMHTQDPTVQVVQKFVQRGRQFSGPCLRCREIVEIPQRQFLDQVVDKSVVVERFVPLVWEMMNTAKVSP